jgi:hypothetical protein
MGERKGKKRKEKRGKKRGCSLRQEAWERGRDVTTTP